MNWLLAPYRDPQTYRTAAYLTTGLFFGIFDFVVIVTGFALGLGLAITVIGFPVLVATFAVAHSLATLERRLARSLLNAPIPKTRVSAIPSGGYIARLRNHLSNQRTWAELSFLILRLPMGILDFVVVVSVVGLALGGFVYPWLTFFGVESSVGSWVIDTVPESLLYVPVSTMFLIVGGRLIEAWGTVSRTFATRLLGWLDRDELKRQVADIIVKRGSVDAFEILSEVEHRLGRRRVVDATRVQATLLALEQTGHITGSADGTRLIYRAA